MGLSSDKENLTLLALGKERRTFSWFDTYEDFDRFVTGKE
jgi:hypothetical protein